MRNRRLGKQDVRIAFTAFSRLVCCQMIGYNNVRFYKSEIAYTFNVALAKGPFRNSISATASKCTIN